MKYSKCSNCLDRILMNELAYQFDYNYFCCELCLTEYVKDRTYHICLLENDCDYEDIEGDAE